MDKEYLKLVCIPMLVIVVSLCCEIAIAQQFKSISDGYYSNLSVSQPPDELGLNPFYEKYTNAHGIPVIASGKVPDAGLLVARDVILYMLADRPDLRRHMVENGFRVGVMAVTDSTTDLPEQRDWEKPQKDDRRLTDGERERYERIEKMTDQEYWNKRARGMGGRYTTCAEENILGYQGEQHKYYGENILVHEFSHAIHRAIHRVEPELTDAIGAAYRRAMEKGLWEGHYGSNTVAEYWAEGTQFWFNSNYEYMDGNTRVLSSDDLRSYDPDLFRLLDRVYPGNHIPMDVFYKHHARIRSR